MKLFKFILFIFFACGNVYATQSVFTDPSLSSCTDAGPANTGNGTCSVSSATAFVQSETWTLTALNSGPVASFSVSGSVSGAQQNIVSGSSQTVKDSFGLAKFTVTLSDGGTAYVAGDNFTVTTTPGTELKKSNFDLFSLDQICANGCNASAAVTGSSFIPSSSTVPTNGIYLPSANTVGIAINSSLGASLSSTGLSVTGQTHSFTGSTSGGIVGVAILNSSNTGSSSARLNISVAGASGGDPLVGWNVNGVTSWTGGISNSDSDAWFLSASGLVGTNPVIRADYSTFDVAISAGELKISTAGKGLQIKEGSNAVMGTATLNGTTAVTINTTAVTANSRIFLTIQAPAGTPASAYVNSRSAGASFTVKSTGAADTSTVAWMIVEPL